MATYYTKSTASGAADGSSWANAYTTIKTGSEARLAGDFFDLSNNHAETGASSLTITSPGTAASPQSWVCAVDTATPPTSTATTASLTTTGTSGITLLGFANVYGLTINCGTGAGNSTLTVGSGTTSSGYVFDSCALKLLGTSASARMAFGTQNTNSKDAEHKLVNTTLQFSSTSQGINVNNGKFIWQGGSIAGATLPTTLFLAGGPAIVYVSGVDLSALGSGKNLVNAAATVPTIYYFDGCKLGASVSAITGTIAGPGGVEVYIDNCDSGATNTRMEHYKYQGSIVNEVTKVRSGGASDGTNSLSWKMTTLSAGPTFRLPLICQPLITWNNTTGASKTATVEILHDSVTALTNADIWLEVEYLGDSSTPKATYANSRVSDELTTASNQSSSSATWTTTGLTNPNKQKLSVTFTPQMKGVVRAWVHLAKSSYTVYVDPLITIA